MPAQALKQRVINRIDFLDDEQTLNVISYIDTLPKAKHPLQNSKTPEERELARKAFENLLAMSFAGSSDVSKDGAKEVADAVMNKYESIDRH